MELKIGHAPPLFAHEVAVSTVYRGEKTKTGKLKKEACTELIFFDGLKKQSIARIVLPQSTLKNLPKMIEENIKNTKKELKNKELPKKPKVETTTNNASYVG
ncbi:MAG: hypothetical protein PVJ67_04425 [Candidatus Pacearchaeota archaeon]|jgi:hypothetical protein